MSYMTAESRRLAFIDAAVKVLVKEGAARITTRRVAAVAKASLASFHYVFAGKDELLRGVVERYLNLLDEKCALSLKPGRGLRGGVKDLLGLIMQFCRSDPEFHLAQYELFVWAARTPSARQLVRYAYERWFERVELILGGCTRKPASSDELRALARSFLLVADGMVLQILALQGEGPGAADLDKLAAAVMACGAGSHRVRQPAEMRTATGAGTPTRT